MPKKRDWTKFRGKYWCFTTNNPSTEDLPPNVWPDVQFVIWQHECGNEEETEHLQGYVCFTKTKQLSWIKSNCCDRSHWEGRLGTHSEAKDYCSKDDTRMCDPPGSIVKYDYGPWTHGSDEGIAEGQGSRVDWDQAKADLDEGKSMTYISENHFPLFIRSGRGLRDYQKLHARMRDWITTVTVYWGEPGVGKSRRARFEAGPTAFWLPQPQGSDVWWDGYAGQEVVVIDEFYGWMKRVAMQRLCDSTPEWVPIKGDMVPFLAKRIIITSNSPPSQWWPNVGLGPMLRRLEGAHGTVVHMTEPWVQPMQADEPPPPEIQPVTPPWSPSLEWAMFGTPDDGPGEIASPHSAHEQDPLSRCPQCHRHTTVPEICEQCVELNIWLRPYNSLMFED